MTGRCSLLIQSHSKHMACKRPLATYTLDNIPGLSSSHMWGDLFEFTSYAPHPNGPI